jgi:hypothetical protein
VSALEPLVQALLGEGLFLYPYRLDALKNRRRHTLGCVLPRAFAERSGTLDRWRMQAELVVRGGTSIRAAIRFLLCGADDRQARIDLAAPLGRSCTAAFASDGVALEARLVTERLCGSRFSGAWRVTVALDNVTAVDPAIEREAALGASVASALAELESDGAFVSAQDPPAELAAVATGAEWHGWFVVLAGEGALASPIALLDHPRIADESPGDLFDAAEIDELLTLRVRTLGDGEKEAMRADPRTRALLDRCEALGPEALAALHGRLRGAPAIGDRVRLRPRRRADAFDLMLAGRAAMVAAVMQDLEGEVQLAVVLDDDPGRDLGIDGMPGHRFFFRPDEVEPL